MIKIYQDNSRFDVTEDNILESEDIETIHNEIKKDTIIFKNEISISDQWENFKQPKIFIIGVPTRKSGKKKRYLSK